MRAQSVSVDGNGCSNILPRMSFELEFQNRERFRAGVLLYKLRRFLYCESDELNAINNKKLCLNQTCEYVHIFLYYYIIRTLSLKVVVLH